MDHGWHRSELELGDREDNKSCSRQAAPVLARDKNLLHKYPRVSVLAASHREVIISLSLF